MKSISIRRLSYINAHLAVLVVSCVILGAFGVQFVGKEYPCPLCYLQRMAMILAVLGPARMISIGRRKGCVDTYAFSTGFGMTVLASILGAAISIRQILLHIAPGDPGYGSPVFGLHLYTWALFVFVALLIDAGLHLTFIREDVPLVPLTPKLLSKLVVWLFLLVITANAIAVFVQTGFHWFLLDDPTGYRLFQ